MPDLFRYRLQYMRRDNPHRIHHMTVTAADADEARRITALRDPLYLISVASPRRGGRVVIEPPDPMDEAKARDDLLKGVAHFDREYVEWRGADVEVTG